jgi:hypothetical protein
VIFIFTTILPFWLTQIWDQFWYYRRGKIKFHIFKVGDTYHAIASNGIITVVNCYGSTPLAAKEMALFKLKKAMAERE